MILRKFYINLIIRVVFIGLTCMTLSFCIYKTDFIFANINLFLFIILQLVLLIRFLNKVNRDLKKFFTSVKNEDSTLMFIPEDSNKSNNEFQNCLDELNSVIRNIRIENERQNQYFKNVVEHVGIGLISFNNEGQIELHNKAALQLFQIHNIHNISEFDRFNKDFSNILTKMKAGETRLIDILLEDVYEQDQQELMSLSIKASEFVLLGNKLKLVSFQNIKRELEGKELESWQKLTRVLSHEIMNSISPLTSLAKTIVRYFRQNNQKPKDISELNSKIINKTIDGLKIIEERGEGLLNFVADYRSYASLPEPVYEIFSLSYVFDNIHKLHSRILQMENILLVKDIYPEELKIRADKKFLDQILINLINNSISGLKNREEDRIIKLKAFVGSTNNIVLQVIDNGEGIGEELKDKIFIPFFTTREKGSGIGLSLCRQIMHLHGGSITVVSRPGVETSFSLKF